MKFSSFSFQSLSILIILGFLTACNNESDPVKKIILNLNSENDLLPKKVYVNYEVNTVEQNFPEWLQGVDTALMHHLTENVLNSEQTVYSPMIQYTGLSTEIIDRKEIGEALNVPNPLGVSALYFIESWFFNQVSYQFRKELETWSPVFLFHKIHKKDTVLGKKLLFDLKCVGGTASKLLAKNITYEVSLNPESPNYINFAPVNFAQLILNSVLTGEKIIVNYLDSTNISIDEVKILMGKVSDTLLVVDPNTGDETFEIHNQAEQFDRILGYIFVEDWFVNPDTYVITKTVKSIAPVYYGSRLLENGKPNRIKRLSAVSIYNH